MQVQFACDWRSLGYNLNATARQLHTIFHALAASTVQSRQFFESTLPEQFFWIKKWGNHRKTVLFNKVIVPTVRFFTNIAEHGTREKQELLSIPV